MPQTQIACPRCRQMITANIEQLFDVTQDPQAKQRLLGGVSNMARCPHCGYQGRLATPIVYHDNEKELLLTFFPPELNMQLNEQERLIGPLIKQVTDRLPPEKRKGYLLNPVPNLTYESMIQTILGKDGITPEMLLICSMSSSLPCSAGSRKARRAVGRSLSPGQWWTSRTNCSKRPSSAAT
jgi:hypothetical protein